MNSFLSAVGFLTIFPVPRRVHGDAGALAYAWVWFPLVGFLVGVLSGALGWLTLTLGASVLLSGTVVVLALVLFTRGFHYDGFSDTVDASLGGFSIEDRLRIMKDPHVGSFAVLALILLVLFQVQAIAHLRAQEVILTVALAGALSRWGVLWPMFFMAYAKQTGLGLLFVKSSPKYLLTTLFVAGFLTLVGGVGALLVMFLTFVCALLVSVFARYRFGGLTGDVCGFVIILLELFVLFLYVPVAQLIVSLT